MNAEFFAALEVLAQLVIQFATKCTTIAGLKLLIHVDNRHLRQVRPSIALSQDVHTVLLLLRPKETLHRGRRRGQQQQGFMIRAAHFCNLSSVLADFAVQTMSAADIFVPCASPMAMALPMFPEPIIAIFILKYISTKIVLVVCKTKNRRALYSLCR